MELLEAFALGFLSSLTPCVFPLIPITLALFGARETQSRLEGFLLGLSYVGGIAVTYTTLGMITAKLGIIFGSFLGNPWVILILSIFLILIALQTLDILEFSFISSVQTKASKIGGKGYTGAFLMGTVSGLVAAPCIGPALIAILALAAQSQSVIWGAALLFFYSLGLGLIFLALATFSNLMKKLPKAGNWLNGVKFFLTCLLLLILIFITQSYLTPLLEFLTYKNQPLLLAGMCASGILLALYTLAKGNKFLKLIAAILVSFSSYQFFLHSSKGEVTYSQNQQQMWLNYEDALKLSLAEKRPILLDLYADWCAACKEFELITFKDPRVHEMLKTIITSRVDFTDTTTPLAVQLTEKYQIPGLPLIIILKPDGNGTEVEGSRITGFVGPDEFLKHLEKFLK